MLTQARGRKTRPLAPYHVHHVVHLNKTTVTTSAIVPLQVVSIGPPRLLKMLSQQKSQFSIIFSENSNVFFAASKQAMGPRQCWRLQNLSFCILLWLICHNILTSTPCQGNHRVFTAAEPHSTLVEQKLPKTA